MSTNQRADIVVQPNQAAHDRPADKHYTAIDGHTYDNSPRWARYTGEWYFSSAFAVHSDECPCLTDPEFHR